MPITLTDKVSYNQLVACCNNEFWYEDLSVSAGTMIELTAANGTIDTTDQLAMFEGFQKCFIVNGAKLYVADFINTKLTHTALTTAHAKGDILTQAVTDATMVVDYTNTAKTNTYGYVTSGTFTVSANNISGSGLGTTFQATAVTAKPHWYAWTVYPGGASGTMPTKAYIGCLYRGRAVLSGNPNYPYQWYMSRQGNLWDWAYVANDAQSPVAGGNSDAGELGDIVRALVPCRDEYLLFGCANSLWVLRGDPADGGRLDEVDLTKGFFGASSWCFDADGNLYFMSKSGLHVLASGLGVIKDLSALVLPNLIKDELLDPSLHRVSMVYDVERAGLLIYITTLASGANSNYFYDLRTDGFFPESFNSTIGVYSGFYYPSTDDSYRGIILGCADGYLRKYSETEKNDVGTSADLTITSHCTLPVITAEDIDKNVLLSSLTVITAGGATSGDFGDTDGVTVQVYANEDAETVIEDIIDGAVPQQTVTLTGSGRQERIRTRTKDGALAIRFYNATSDETWAIESVSAEIKEKGKVR
jgi:hypothetical protein